MALAEELNIYDPVAAAGRVMRGSTTEQRGGLARKGYEGLMREESAAREDVLREEQAAKKTMIEEEIGVEKDYAAQKRKEVEQYQAGLQPSPEPQITQFDANAAAEVAGITAILGALTGMKSGRAALKSMAGFTEGHKQGRQDLYKREIDNFEREYKRWKDNNVLAKQILDQSLDLLSTDRNAAMVNLKRLDPLIQDGLILAKVRQGDVVGAKQVFDKAIELENKLDVAIETALGKPPKISDKQRTAINQNQELLRRLQNLRNTAKKDYFALASVPLIADQLADLRIDMQEIGLGDLASIFGLDVTDQAVLWWKDYYDLIADIRKERFGATLTGNELKSFRQTSVKPSSTFEIGTGVLDRQIELARQSHQNVMQSIGREQPTAGAAQTDVNTIRQQAQAAIAAGKDEAQVRAKFRELTGQEL